MGFAREAIEAVGDDWAAIEPFNEILERLQRRRQDSVAAKGDLAKAKVAWKVCVFQQVILYRIVMLAEGTSQMWNSRNILGSILCARALFESSALALDFEQKVERLCENNDLKSIDALVTNRTFATRKMDWLESAPDTQAVNVLSLVDSLDKKIDGSRNHYDNLSEMCHPNSLGHFMVFSNLDKQDGTVYLSDIRRFDHGVFSHVMAAFMSIGLVEHAFDRMDRLMPRIVDLNVR